MKRLLMILALMLVASTAQAQDRIKVVLSISVAQTTDIDKESVWSTQLKSCLRRELRKFQDVQVYSSLADLPELDQDELDHMYKDMIEDYSDGPGLSNESYRKWHYYVLDFTGFDVDNRGIVGSWYGFRRMLGSPSGDLTYLSSGTFIAPDSDNMCRLLVAGFDEDVLELIR